MLQRSEALWHGNICTHTEVHYDRIHTKFNFHVYTRGTEDIIKWHPTNQFGWLWYLGWIEEKDKKIENYWIAFKFLKHSYNYDFDTFYGIQFKSLHVLISQNIDISILLSLKCKLSRWVAKAWEGNNIFQQKRTHLRAGVTVISFRSQQLEMGWIRVFTGQNTTWLVSPIFFSTLSIRPWVVQYEMGKNWPGTSC